MVTGRGAQSLETNNPLLKRLGPGTELTAWTKRSTTPFAPGPQATSTRQTPGGSRGPRLGSQAAVARPGTPRARQTPPQRKAGALGPPASRSRRVPFPVPSQDTAEADAGTVGPSTTPPSGGSAPGSAGPVRRERRALTVHGLPHRVQVGRGRRARAATARHGEERPPPRWEKA